MTEQILQDQRLLWKNKPVLRKIYQDYYKRIAAHCIPGITLEIGGGSGNMKEYIGEVISTDIVPTPWLDAAADAQAMPFRCNTFANIVAVDVLHHIEGCRRFFNEAERILKPGGNIILIEPAITPISWFFYQFFHPERVDMRIDPFVDPTPDPARLPFDANQAIPTLLFSWQAQRFAQEFPGLHLAQAEYFSLLGYPLSGGFRSWCLIPRTFISSLLRIEDHLSPLIGQLLGFRLFIVIEKRVKEPSDL